MICIELLERTQWLEETARRLLDLSEQLRDLAHSVQRVEDRLASHDALGGAARDPKMLDGLKVFIVFFLLKLAVSVLLLQFLWYIAQFINTF